jgi:hypothetical protein
VLFNVTAVILLVYRVGETCDMRYLINDHCNSILS